ncbi:YceD family protein [Paracoccus siganidrum]|uniref:DUF177 domain-containing protein n=1 Tax=Paracoccus siganidrum TaxID=1276757 RepID=A0A418ZUD2_9RHOB|nr:DUF177 domain-containing protein [Paracoccus siganidrum]RJL03347.1 DUF177 domain-containing protein [Paracoccus siganidrum]RMC41088.1 DUF177 domain-containing protein [Paracoccus siganidrum]
MTAAQTHPLRLRVAHLNPRAPTAFALRPDAEARAAIAGELGLPGLPRLAFEGRIRAGAGDGWELEGRLTARVTQACVVTLKPVKTTIDEQVRRLYSPHLATPEADEAEMPDDALEPLGQFIDVSAVMVEELALALPEYPRADGAGLDSPAGDAPDSDTRKPFAGLDQLLRGKD